jgi:hypothetical protein
MAGAEESILSHHCEAHRVLSALSHAVCGGRRYGKAPGSCVCGYEERPVPRVAPESVDMKWPRVILGDRQTRWGFVPAAKKSDAGYAAQRKDEKRKAKRTSARVAREKD